MYLRHLKYFDYVHFSVVPHCFCLFHFGLFWGDYYIWRCKGFVLIRFYILLMYIWNYSNHKLRLIINKYCINVLTSSHFHWNCISFYQFILIFCCSVLQKNAPWAKNNQSPRETNPILWKLGRLPKRMCFREKIRLRRIQFQVIPNTLFDTDI